MLRDFVKTLVTQGRDVAIHQAVASFANDFDDITDKRWKRALPSISPDDLRRDVIPDVVDTTIFQLLVLIENGDLELALRGEGGDWQSLQELFGYEASGEYIGTDGWREAFSTESVNPF